MIIDWLDHKEIIISITSHYHLINSNYIPRTCAMNMAAAALYKAVPPILIAAPIDIRNFEILVFKLFLSSKYLVQIRMVELL